MNLTIDFQNKELNQYMNTLIKKFPVEVADATRLTAMESARIAKKELPKRTGILRKSVIPQRKNRFEYLLWHGRNLKTGKLKYADTIEAGRGPVTIKPKRAKALMWGTRKNVVRLDGGIRAPIKRAFFNALRDRVDTKANLQKKYGVVLLKKGQAVKQKSRRGQWNYRDRILPKTETAFKRHLYIKFKKLGFV